MQHPLYVKFCIVCAYDFCLNVYMIFANGSDGQKIGWAFVSSVFMHTELVLSSSATYTFTNTRILLHQNIEPKLASRLFAFLPYGTCRVHLTNELLAATIGQNVMLPGRLLAIFVYVFHHKK